MGNHIILIGSLLLVTLFFISPSIPAIQINNLQNKIQQYPQELKTELHTQKSKNILELPENRTLLYLFVMTITYFWLIRISILIKILNVIEDIYSPFFSVISVLIFLRLIPLVNRADWWLIIWDAISEHYGWGWKWSK
jgi:hypothetical protein